MGSYGLFDQFGDGGIQIIEVMEVNTRFTMNAISIHSSPIDARMAAIRWLHKNRIDVVVREEQGHFSKRKILRFTLINLSWFQVIILGCTCKTPYFKKTKIASDAKSK